MSKDEYVEVPVSAAKDVADKYDKDQVIIVAWDKAYEMTHVTTYGRTRQQSAMAADGGNFVKQALGWPPKTADIPDWWADAVLDLHEVHERVCEKIDSRFTPEDQKGYLDVIAVNLAAIIDKAVDYDWRQNNQETNQDRPLSKKRRRLETIADQYRIMLLGYIADITLDSSVKLSVIVENWNIQFKMMFSGFVVVSDCMPLFASDDQVFNWLKAQARAMILTYNAIKPEEFPELNIKD